MPRINSVSNRSLYSRGGNDIKQFRLHNLQKPIDVDKKRTNIKEGLEFYSEYIEPLLRNSDVVDSILNLNIPVEFIVDPERTPRSLYSLRKMLREYHLVDIKQVSENSFMLFAITREDLKDFMPLF